MTEKATGSVGTVETRYFTFAQSPHELLLENGEKLGPVTLAYEVYGELNAERSNAILLHHAFSGNAHVAGFHAGDDRPGWWDDMVGPGKAFDTNRFFVICSSVIGSCTGSTGPCSENPATGEPYGLEFPMVTIRDMVEAQRHLIDHLGIEQLLCVAGGSMGGMQTLQWLVSYPERVRSAIPIATTAKHSPQQIAFNEVGRQAIMADPNWEDGKYYGKSFPGRGLSVARMIGHITYMSEISMEEKFSRRIKNDRAGLKFSADFEVEGYLRHRGDSFVKRFDANAYLYITKAMDHFDLAGGKNLYEVFRGIRAKIMVIAFRSDWLYPIYQSQEITRACKLAGLDATYCEIDSTYGHDAFLLEIETLSQFIHHFLLNVYSEAGKID